VTSFTDKHLGLNGLGQRGLEGSARYREDEASSFATRAIRMSLIRGLSTAVLKMLFVNPPINVPRVTYRPTKPVTRPQVREGLIVFMILSQDPLLVPCLRQYFFVYED
jgi:hypothetical protein